MSQSIIHKSLFFECIQRDWGHLHSTYAQRGKERVKPNAYDCVQGGREGFKVAYLRKKMFFGPQNLKTFLFLHKRSYYIAICYCV